MSAPQWLEAMPAIPLARSVPVVMVGDPEMRGVALSAAPNGRRAYVRWNDGDGPHGYQDEDVRVDLGDNQGFAYAIRWLHGAVLAMPDSPRRELRETDRLTLARALSEVTP